MLAVKKKRLHLLLPLLLLKPLLLLLLHLLKPQLLLLLLKRRSNFFCFEKNATFGWLFFACIRPSQANQGSMAACSVDLEPRRTQQGIGHLNVGRLTTSSQGHEVLCQVGAVVAFAQMGCHDQVQTGMYQRFGELR